jgi:hypothetical protein
MSNEINEQLMERAASMIDYYEGKLPAQMIELDLERNDLDALYDHVCAAEAMLAQEEFENADIY